MMLFVNELDFITLVCYNNSVRSPYCFSDVGLIQNFIERIFLTATE